MSWFDQGNKISERDLIAYHLHELPPRREREVARALEHSASLTAVSASVEATLRAVKDTPRPIDQAAFTRTWAVLQPQLNLYAIPVPAKPHWQTPVFAKAALAGLAAVGVGVLAVRMYKPSSNLPAPAAPSAFESAAATATADTDHLPSVPSTGTFHDRLSPSLPRPRPQQAWAPPTHILTPYPKPSEPQTASSQPLSQTPDEPFASLPTPPREAETPAGQTVQQTAPANIRAGNIKQHSVKMRTGSQGTDVMLALGGTLFAERTSLVTNTEQNTQTATHAIAAVGAFHQQLRPALGYRVTLSYTRPDFENTSVPANGGGYYGGGHVNSQLYEAAATYVIQGPHHGRWSTSGDAGGALMTFLPTDNVSITHVFRPAGVLALNLDYAIAKHWAARATYRVQVFRGPNFRYADSLVPVTPSVLVSNEPSMGLVYRFGKTESRPRKPWAP